MTTPASSPPQPSQRGKRTRDALLAAGHRLLAERPIDALAIDDIVQAAGVAKGSFYNHFEDKEALASTIRAGFRHDVEAAISAVNKDIEDPAKRVARALSVYMAHILAFPQRANVVLRISAGGLASTHNPLNEGVLRDVSEGLRVGRFVVPSVEAGAMFVIGAAQISLMYAAEEANRSLTTMMAQQICALMLRGLGVPFAEAEALSAQATHELVTSPADAAPQ